MPKFKPNKFFKMKGPAMYHVAGKGYLGRKAHNKKHADDPNYTHKDKSLGAISARVVKGVKEGVEKVAEDFKNEMGNNMIAPKAKPKGADVTKLYHSKGAGKALPPKSATKK